MKVEGLNESIINGRPRISATMHWEDNDRPATEIFFETDAEFKDDLTCHAHPFFVAGVVPALASGEKRIAIEDDVCPELRAGVETAVKLIQQWHSKEEYLGIKVEVRKGKNKSCITRKNRAGFFFSGGVDSLATLRANRLNIPLDHPGAFKDGILVYGLEVTDPDAFSYVREAMHEIAADAGITLVPIYTNVRELNDDWHFWQYQWEGAVFSAVAHSLANRIGTVHIASTHDIKSLIPYGSHPLLDPLFSSCSTAIKHDGIGLSRLQRTQLISGWTVARNNLRVCNRSEEYENGRLNCGKCEKCIRTMLELLATGSLDVTEAFTVKDVSSEAIKALPWVRPASRHFYTEMIAPLHEKGRSDLANAIEEKLQSMIPPKSKGVIQNTLDTVWKLDRKISGGRLYRLGKKFIG